jgi:hypothetical protein
MHAGGRRRRLRHGPTGLVDVKGKGDVETWRMVSRNGH